MPRYKRRTFQLVHIAIVALVAFVTIMAGAVHAPSAHAENNSHAYGSIDFSRKGSLTITKLEKTDQNGTTPGNGKQQTVSGNTLAGVTFKLTPVENFDLKNGDNWANLDKLSLSGNTVLVNGKASGASLAQTSQSQTTDGNGQAVFSNLPVGLYYVQETDTGSHIVTQPAEPFFVTVPYPISNPKDYDATHIYDVYVYPKNSLGKTPSTEKNVDIKDALKTGDTISWDIDQEIPQSATAPTRFGIVDKLHDALAYRQVAVTALDSQKNTIAEFTADADYTVNVDGQTITVEFTEAGRTKLTNYSLIRFTIDTTVKQAPNGSIPNDVFPIVNGYDPFHSDPNNPPVHTSTRPVFGAYQLKKTGDRYVTPIEVKPHDFFLLRNAAPQSSTSLPNRYASDNDHVLEGAEFALWRKPVDGCVAGQYADNTIKTMTATSGTDGMVAFNGILVGSATAEQADDTVSAPFCLQETKAPAGYKKNMNVYEITVNGGPFNEKIHAFNNEPANGTTLPMTGSTGIITIATAAIVAGLIAAGLIIKTRHTRVIR